jgi:uncharacterized lipoprotein YmbA
MRTYRFIRRIVLLGSLPILIAGCLFGSTPPSRFYTLAPQEAATPVVASTPVSVLVVGPIGIPAYLDRKQIVTRSGGNELILAEFNRWGRTLESEITGALIAQLQERLSPAGISAVSWESVPFLPVKVIYQVPVGISRFDGILGESVVLRCRWGVIAKREGKDIPSVDRELSITEKVDGGSYGAQVAAMQRALARLGKEIADSIPVAKAP